MPALGHCTRRPPVATALRCADPPGLALWTQPGGRMGKALWQSFPAEGLAAPLQAAAQLQAASSLCSPLAGQLPVALHPAMRAIAYSSAIMRAAQRGGRREGNISTVPVVLQDLIVAG